MGVHRDERRKVLNFPQFSCFFWYKSTNTDAEGDSVKERACITVVLVVKPREMMDVCWLLLPETEKKKKKSKKSKGGGAKNKKQETSAPQTPQVRRIS